MMATGLAGPAVRVPGARRLRVVRGGRAFASHCVGRGGEAGAGPSSEGPDSGASAVGRRLRLEKGLLEMRSRARRRADRGAPGEAAQAAYSHWPGQQGVVHLVGTGPGDPELLTIKALRVMQAADVVLYDRLCSPEILALVGARAEMIYVGKESGFHTRTQSEIHMLLVEHVAAGRRVVRLKGGDPAIFGRGGEEMEYLESLGIPVDVVPGITAAVGIGASLGVPLTHRDFASSVRFVTGHARADAGDDVDVELEFSRYADPDCTLVVYMGLGNLPRILAGLRRAGTLPPDTPCLAVQNGTTLDERCVLSTLECFGDDVARAGLQSPTLVVVGGVASFFRPEAAAEWAIHLGGGRGSTAEIFEGTGSLACDNDGRDTAALLDLVRGIAARP